MRKAFPQCRRGFPAARKNASYGRVGRKPLTVSVMGRLPETRVFAPGCAVTRKYAVLAELPCIFMHASDSVFRIFMQ